MIRFWLKKKYITNLPLFYVFPTKKSKLKVNKFNYKQYYYLFKNTYNFSINPINYNFMTNFYISSASLFRLSFTDYTYDFSGFNFFTPRSYLNELDYSVSTYSAYWSNVEKVHGLNLHGFCSSSFIYLGFFFRTFSFYINSFLNKKVKLDLRIFLTYKYKWLNRFSDFGNYKTAFSHINVVAKTFYLTSYKSLLLDTFSHSFNMFKMLSIKFVYWNYVVWFRNIFLKKDLFQSNLFFSAIFYSKRLKQFCLSSIFVKSKKAKSFWGLSILPPNSRTGRRHTLYFGRRRSLNFGKRKNWSIYLKRHVYFESFLGSAQYYLKTAVILRDVLFNFSEYIRFALQQNFVFFFNTNLNKLNLETYYLHVFKFVSLIFFRAKRFLLWTNIYHNKYFPLYFKFQKKCSKFLLVRCGYSFFLDSFVSKYKVMAHSLNLQIFCKKAKIFYKKFKKFNDTSKRFVNKLLQPFINSRVKIESAPFGSFCKRRYKNKRKIITYFKLKSKYRRWQSFFKKRKPNFYYKNKFNRKYHQKQNFRYRNSQQLPERFIDKKPHNYSKYEKAVSLMIDMISEDMASPNPNVDNSDLYTKILELAKSEPFVPKPKDYYSTKKRKNI